MATTEHTSDVGEIERLPAKVVRCGGTVMSFEEPRRAYKVVEDGETERIATLIVPAGTDVVYPKKESGSWNNEHLRVERAIVDEIEGVESAKSVVSGEWLYHVGDVVVPNAFSDDPTEVSAPGIHVFATRKGAEHWSKQ